MELLVVIAIIAILAALLLPVLSQAKGKAQGMACLNNGKQMMTAVTLYTTDNNEFFPPNPDGGTTDPGYNWCAGQAGNRGADEFNPDLIKDPAHSLLIGYLGGNNSIFKCPADARMGLYDGTNPSLIGQIVPAARTFSMNNAVGTIDPGFDASGPGPGSPHSGIPNLSVNGPWLNNQDTTVGTRHGAHLAKPPTPAPPDHPCSGCWWTKTSTASMTRLYVLEWSNRYGMTLPAHLTTEVAALPLQMDIPKPTGGSAAVKRAVMELSLIMQRITRTGYGCGSGLRRTPLAPCRHRRPRNGKSCCPPMNNFG